MLRLWIGGGIYLTGQTVFTCPAETFTSIGFIDAAWTLMSSSFGALISGIGRLRIWYSSGLQYFSIASERIVVSLS